MKYPTAYARTMRQHLFDESLYLNPKWVRRLMRKMGNTLDASESVEVLQQMIARFGTPEIINSDQGSQYTSGLRSEACGNTMKNCLMFHINSIYLRSQLMSTLYKTEYSQIKGIKKTPKLLLINRTLS